MTAEDELLGAEQSAGIRGDFLAPSDADELPLEEAHWTDQPPKRFDQVALRIFGSMAKKRMVNHPQLGMKLAKARIVIVPSAYLAGAYLKAAMVMAFGLLSFSLYLLLAGRDADPGIAVPLALSPIVFAVMAYSYTMYQPDQRIRSRRKNLDENLPYALNFMAAMSGAGVVPVEVFGSLASQKVYGEMSTEATAIYRDTKIFSKDIMTAMRDAARRSPSLQFEEFLMGSVNTVSSGGDLRSYFLSRSQFLMQENRRKQKSFLESLGVMAESYVVIGAAAPLFVIVTISILVLVNSGIKSPESILNIIVLLGMPIIHGMFGYIISSMKAT